MCTLRTPSASPSPSDVHLPNIIILHIAQPVLKAVKLVASMRLKQSDSYTESSMASEQNQFVIFLFTVLKDSLYYYRNLVAKP